MRGASHVSVSRMCQVIMHSHPNADRLQKRNHPYIRRCTKHVLFQQPYHPITAREGISGINVWKVITANESKMSSPFDSGQPLSAVRSYSLPSEVGSLIVVRSSLHPSETKYRSRGSIPA